MLDKLEVGYGCPLQVYPETVYKYMYNNYGKRVIHYSSNDCNRGHHLY